MLIRRYSIFVILMLAAASASAGPITTPWPVEGPDDTAGVAAAALSGWYATADTYEDAVELRDIRQSLQHTITRQQITALLPWMSLDGSEDGPNALAFSDSGRLLFIAVHDANAAPDGQPSDAILRYDTQTSELNIYARLEISSTDGPWRHNALAFYKGRLYAGLNGAINVYRANMNDRTGPLLFTQLTAAGVPTRGIAIDRAGPYLYAAWNDTLYRAPLAGSLLNFTLVGGGITNIRGLTYSDNFGGAANPGLYILESTTTPAFARIWYVNPSQARGLLPYSASTYLFQPANLHAIAATADGKMLIGADEDALLLSDSTDTRLGFDAWAADEFAQVVTYARGLIAPDANNLSGLVIDADVEFGATRFHPATPDAACWTVLLLMMNDHLNGDPLAQTQVRTILQRYAGLAPDGIAPQRTADGIYRHWISPTTAQLAPGWDGEFATMSTMKIVLAASRAASFYPNDQQIQAAAHAIICGVHDWDTYLQPGTDRMYLTALATTPDFGSASSPFHEGMIFVSEAAAYGSTVSQGVYSRWLDRTRWPSAQLVLGRTVTTNQNNNFLPAFVSLYELLVTPEFRASPSWQTHIRNLRLSNAAWTDDNAPKYFTVFSAGTTASPWGGYHADSLTDHPGDVTTFPSLLAFSAGTAADGPSTPEAVAAYNAYRRGAREHFATGARMLFRRSNIDQNYNPDSAGLPDVGLGALGLAELLMPGSIDQVLAIPHIPCTTCGSADFNGDGDVGTDADIEAFFACLAGACCPTCGTADFNNDGDIGTDADIESFFRVLAGGPC